MKNTVFPHKFGKPFLDCMPRLFFRPQHVWFPVHLKGLLIPLWYETLVVNWQNWLFTLFYQSRSVLSPNLIGCSGTNFSEILIKTQYFSFTKMHLKISPAKWRPYCPGEDELTHDLSDTIWWHRSGTTLAQVTAWCLMAPNHYLYQCWLPMGGVLWYSPQEKFIGNAQGI